MNSSNEGQVSLQQKPIVIHVKGLGHIISLKNKKRGGIGTRKDGSKYPMSWTPRNVKEWMEKCTQLIESQLLFDLAITEGATLTDASTHSSTALSRLPMGFDDSRQWLKEIHVMAEVVECGEEGAVLTIEEITPSRLRDGV